VVGASGQQDRSPPITTTDHLPLTTHHSPLTTEARRAGSSGFLPLSLAVSFFFMWAISGAGQPSSMVRLMAFNNATTFRRSIFTVAMYYSMIYFPLVIIFCCARVLQPGMDLESDRIMPQMAVTLTANAGHVWLAGLLIAAPFAAVMSTVDSFLLMISSALVRDIYQRNINPEATERRIKRLSYFFTLVVGVGAMLGAVNPPQFLQDIIVYTGSGLAACFLGPMVFALYWPRVNAVGATSGMLAGFLAHLAMYVTGWFVHGSFFRPFQIFNLDPIIIGLVVSFVTVYVVTLLTPPPPEDLVRKYFYKR
jgi:sodium/pantothenate symporter